MVKRKDKEIKPYKLKNGQTYFRLKTYIGTNPETGKAVKVTRSKLKTRKEAEQLRIQLKAKGPANIANKLEISNSKRKVRDVYAEWLETVSFDVRGSTLYRFKNIWKNHIEAEFGDDFVNNISPDKLQNYVNELAQNYSSYRQIANQLQRIIHYAIVRKWADTNPFDRILLPKKSLKAKKDTSQNFYELDELKEFLATSKAYDNMKYTFFLIVASLGCRRGEALALKWSDIDFEKREITIQRTVAKDGNDHKTVGPVKNGVVHVVPMSNNLFDSLTVYHDYVIGINDASEWLFHNHAGEYLGSSIVDTWIKEIYKFNRYQVNYYNATHPNQKPIKPLRQITPHGLRHTLATLIYHGSDQIKPKDVQYLLGHRSVSTTLNIYTHITKEEKEEIKKSIDNLDF